MSIIADAMRIFWLQGLNDVSGRVDLRLAGWISAGKFQVYNQIGKNKFTLNISDALPLLAAFACDSNRMAVASFESMEGIQKHPELPNSVAWLIIRGLIMELFLLLMLS